MSIYGQQTKKGAGGGAIPVGGTVYVNSTTGDDSTALPYRFDKPFKTITNAQLNTNAGDTIIVSAGNYTDSFLGKDGVRYEFEFGAILTSSGYCFYDFGTTKSFEVAGYGIFFGTGAVCYVAGVASNVEFQCWAATGNSTGARAFWVQGGSEMVVICATDIYTGNGGGGSEACCRVDTNATLTPKLTVYANRIISESIPLQTKQNQVNGSLIVYANEISMTVAGDNYTILEWIGGSVEVHANIRTETSSNYGIAMFQGSGVSLKVYGECNIASDKFIAISAGQVYFHNSIVTTGTIFNGGANLYLLSTIIGTSATQVLYHNGGKTIVYSLIRNTVLNAFVIVVNSPGLILKQTASIVNNAVFAAKDSISTTGAYSIKSYPGCVTNNTIDALITELVSNLVQNTLVDSE